MTYLALYRQCRPKTFDDIVGQPHVVRTLKNAITLGKVNHAYLFAGPRGTGKTSTAKVFAKALNCEAGPTIDPCGSCVSCTSVLQGNALDIVEIDAASNRGIDEIRDLREKVKFSPSIGRYKVYIIDEAHMLTVEAFNALLKTLEEPPSHAVFILATTEPHRILPTILSRCQRFDFARIRPSELSAYLAIVARQQGIEADTAAIDLVARRAEGSVRDALGLLEQASSGGDRVTAATVQSLLGVSDFEHLCRYAQAVADGAPGEALMAIHSVLESGGDPRQFLLDIIGHFRDILVAKECPDDVDLLNSCEQEALRLIEQSQGFTRDRVLSVLSILSSGEQDVRRSQSPRLALELVTVRVFASPTPTALEEYEVAPVSSKKPKTAVEKTEEPRPQAQGEKERISSRADGVDLVGLSPSQWGDILLRVKAKSVPLHALLRPVAAVTCEGGVLTIGFQNGWPMHVAKTGEQRNLSVLRSAAGEALGRDLAVEIRVEQGKAVQVGGEERKPAESIGEDPQVQKAIELFAPVDIKYLED